jgi:hypothetical protein
MQLEPEGLDDLHDGAKFGILIVPSAVLLPTFKSFIAPNQIATNSGKLFFGAIL